jgi:hypothetical protein
MPKEVGSALRIVSLVFAFVLALPMVVFADWQGPTENPPQKDRPGYIYNIADPSIDPAQDGNIEITGSATIGGTVQGQDVKAVGSLCINNVCKTAWDALSGDDWSNVVGNESTIYHVSGSVGIGTASPNAKLSVVTTAEAIPQFSIGTTGTDFRVNATANDVSIGTASSDSLTLITSGLPRATITPTGQIGIGTTNAGYPLHIGSDGSSAIVTIENYNRRPLWTGVRLADSSGEQWYLGMDNRTNKLLFRALGFTNVVTFDPLTNRVGIGVDSPTQALDVNGAIKVGNTTVSQAGTIRWNGTDFEGYTATGWKSLTIGTGGATLPTGTDGQTLRYSGTPTAALTANSFLYNNGTAIGIGTTAPARTLHVSGATPIVRVQDGDNGGGAASINLIEYGQTEAGAWSRTGYIGDGFSTARKFGIVSETGIPIEFFTDGGTSAAMAINVGLVGVGTSAPSERFEVADPPGSTTARLRITDIAQNPELQLQYGAGAAEHWGIYTNQTADDLRIWSPTGDKVVVTQAGKVGIGITTPTTFTTMQVHTKQASGTSFPLVVTVPKTTTHSATPSIGFRVTDATDTIINDIDSPEYSGAVVGMSMVGARIIVGATAGDLVLRSDTGGITLGTRDGTLQTWISRLRVQADGTVQITSNQSIPACDDAHRGGFWFFPGSSSQDDQLKMCIRLANSTYVWRNVSMQ